FGLFGQRIEARHGAIDPLRLFGQHGLARRDDSELAPLIVAILLGDQGLVGQHRERRIDHAGAGRIVPARTLLDSLDEVVTVARLLGDELEQDKPQLLAAELPAAAPATASSARPPGTARAPE